MAKAPVLRGTGIDQWRIVRNCNNGLSSGTYTFNTVFTESTTNRYQKQRK